MPAYRFTGPEPRYFPDLALDVVPGEVVTLPENPHEHYFEPAGDGAKPKAKKRAGRKAPALLTPDLEPVTGTAPTVDSQES